jgi:arylformamidase
MVDLPNHTSLWKTPQAHERPVLSIEATWYLVEEIGIHCIGTDATGLEVRGRDDQPVREILFTNDVAVVESLTNLDKLRWSLYSSRACCGTVS